MFAKEKIQTSPLKKTLAKLVLLIVILSFSLDLRSQNSKFGFTGDVEGSSGFVITLRPNLTYTHKKNQFIFGPALSWVFDRNNGNYYGGTHSLFKLTGIALGAKHFINYSCKGGVYYFIDNLVLYYHSYEIICPTSNQQNSPLMRSADAGEGNKQFLIQPVIGSGIEAKFFTVMRFSFDFGFGYCYRSFKFDSSPYHDGLDHFSRAIVHLRVSLGVRI